METNAVRRSIVAAGMKHLTDDLEPVVWASVASVVLRALTGHDQAAPPRPGVTGGAELDPIEGFLAHVESLANQTDGT